MTEKSAQTIWQRNLRVLSIAVFFAGIAFSEIMPFLSLFLATLGDFTHRQLTNWSGIVFSATYLVSTLVTPWWGRLGDAKGRKPMILRAALGMALVIGATGLVTNVWQLLALRMAQGAFAGFVSNSNALIATEVPKEHSGSALGTMMASFTGGNLLGPFIGGTIATFFGYRFTFFLTGFILLMIFFACWRFVDEGRRDKGQRVEDKAENQDPFGADPVTKVSHPTGNQNGGYSRQSGDHPTHTGGVRIAMKQLLNEKRNNRVNRIVS